MYMYIWLCNVPLRIYSKIKCCILCHICVVSGFLLFCVFLMQSLHTGAFLVYTLMCNIFEHVREVCFTFC